MVDDMGKPVNEPARRSAAARRAPDLAILLAISFRAVVDQLDRRLAEAGYPGIRPTHGYVFRSLQNEAIPPSDLARHLGVSKQAIGKLLDEMEAAGLVERRDDPADGRKKRVGLTSRGQAIRRRALEISFEIEAELRAALGTPKTDALIVGLHLFAERFGEHGEAAARRARPVL